MYIWKEKATKTISVIYFDTEEEAISNASSYFLREEFKEDKRVAVVEIYKEVKTVRLIEKRDVDVEEIG